MDSYTKFAALAGSIKNLEDITLDEWNQFILENITSDEIDQWILPSIKRNGRDPITYVYIFGGSRDEDDNVMPNDGDVYCLDTAKALGWLGYIIGEAARLKELVFCGNPFDNFSDDTCEAFCKMLSRNQSIDSVKFEETNLGGDFFRMVGPFFKNRSLRKVDISFCQMSAGWAHSFALALGSCTNSLKHFSLFDYEMGGEPLVQVFVALSMHPQLEHLSLNNASLGANDFLALSTLIQWTTKSLRTLDLCETAISSVGAEALKHALMHSHSLRSVNLNKSGIDDDVLDHLIIALKSNDSLQQLSLRENRSISVQGWKKFSCILEASKITELDIMGNNSIDDEVVQSFASALAKNQVLTELSFYNEQITNKGWTAFSLLLCDTSTVNKTFQSNHTLCTIGINSGPLTRQIVRNRRRNLAEIPAIPALLHSLGLNKCEDKRQVAVEKIATHHLEMNVQPLFEWKFKVLPYTVNWFERAASLPNVCHSDVMVRKLSTLYQFIRAMPSVYIESCIRGQLNKIRADKMMFKKQQLDLEIKLQGAEQEEESLMRML